MSDKNTPYTFAEELLAAAAAATATTDAGTPGRVGIVPPVPALDCEQLTVHVPAFNVGQFGPPGAIQGHRTQLGVRVNIQTLVVTIVRCVPTLDNRGNPPSVAAMQASANAILQDGWTIWNHLSVLIRQGDLFSGKCAFVECDPGSPIQASGGFGGWTIPVRAQIDGYLVVP